MEAIRGCGVKTSSDYAPCVQIHRDGRTRKCNVKAALLLTPDAARHELRVMRATVVYVTTVEDAARVTDGESSRLGTT